MTYDDETETLAQMRQEFSALVELQCARLEGVLIDNYDLGPEGIAAMLEQQRALCWSETWPAVVRLVAAVYAGGEPKKTSIGIPWPVELQ